jgi:alkylhydroperoxidase/carboxymuconolactone decarboxylase family protein YurZ
MSVDDAYERGLEITERLLGRRLDLPMRPGEPASGLDFRKLAIANTFGHSWSRTALDQHDRALVSVAVAATLGAFEPLRGQLRIALKSGVTKDELVDAFIHLGAYAGAARAFEAYEIALEVFAESADARMSDAPGSMAGMERSAVERWVAGYEQAWRTPGTEPLADLFSADVSYLPSPWAEPIVGLARLGPWWEAERDGPDEPFTMTSEIVSMDGDTAVVRVEVDYQGAAGSRWRDLWILRFAADGRCVAFEEWPFAPTQPDGH